MQERYRVVRVSTPPWKGSLFVEFDRQRASEIGVDYAYAPHKAEDDLIEAIRTAHIVIDSGRPLNRRVVTSMANGRLIICASVGYDRVDVAAATECGIAVANLPLFCVDEVADHTMALLLACTRKIVLLDQKLRKGNWGTDLLFPTIGLRGAVLGIIGLGNIGRRVAERARAFGMRVVATDPYLPSETAQGLGVPLTGLDDLLAQSDFVSCHTPLNAETRHLMGAAQFKAMKPTAFFINTSRGGVVDEAALIEALGEGCIAGAGLDVYEKEPLPPTSPLLGLANVVVSPHTAGYSEISDESARVTTWEIVAGFVAGRWPDSVVNPEVKERVQPRAFPTGAA